MTLALSKMTQSVVIDPAATLELTGAASGSITFKGPRQALLSSTTPPNSQARYLACPGTVIHPRQTSWISGIFRLERNEGIIFRQ